MATKSPNLPSSLNKLGRFTFKQAREAGLTQSEVAHLLKTNIIEKINRGIYEVVASSLDPATRDYTTACLTFGESSVIGGLTALFYYGLVEEVSSKIWVLVPPSTYSTNKLYRLIRTKLDLTVGVDKHADFRMTSLERTIVDTFVFSAKIGEKIAYRAALRAIKEKRTTPEKIFRLANKLGVMKRLVEHSQALFGGLEA